MTDHAVEQEIIAKGLMSPRIKPVDVEANIIDEVYFTAADGYKGESGMNPSGRINNKPLFLLTFCVLILRNGFTVTGESACASPENFDAELGRMLARSNAVLKIWPLMGYELRTKLTVRESVSFKQGESEETHL